MDLFAAEHVAPFPDSGDLLFAAGLLSSHHNPQKLRPIRSVPPPPPGYLVNTQSPPNPHPLEPSIKSQDPTESGSGHSQFPTGHEPGSSLDDDDDDDVENSSASTKEFGSRKKRKKTARKLEDFVSSLVKTVMDKQEQMHNELMEMIDKKEKERIEREEAWRREEIERIKKDEEARAAERSRSLALISYIQKLLCHEKIQIPQPEEESQKLLSRAIQIYQPAEGSGKRDEGDVELSNNNRDFNGNLSNNRWPVVVNNNKRDFNGDLTNNRWPDVEVRALIEVRTALEHKFGHMGSKGSIWDEISDALRDRGYNRSAKKCKEKWENINKYYKRTVASGKKRPINSKTCAYFDELDNLYRNGSSSNSLENALAITNHTINNHVFISEEKEQGEI